MLRTVLALALATALLGVSLPVVDSARVDHADAGIERGLERLQAAATDLVADSDPVVAGERGAKRHVQLVLPTGSWARAGTERLEIPPPGSSDRIVWQVEGGTKSVFRPAVPLVSPAGLTLREGGRHRLVVSLHRRGGRQVVLVRRPDV